MDDVVKRLRDPKVWDDPDLLTDAADEIERLRSELERGQIHTAKPVWWPLWLIIVVPLLIGLIIKYVIRHGLP